MNRKELEKLIDTGVGKHAITYQGKTYHYEIDYDDFDESPREWDNLGTIAYSHSRYILGEEKIENETEFYLNLFSQVQEKAPQYLSDEFDQCSRLGEELYYYAENDEHMEKIKEIVHKYFIMLPVYIYDHSGITINTTGFYCPWDSGQVGFIYVSIEKAKSEFNWKLMTQKRIERIFEILDAEIKTFDQYIRGDIYYVTISSNEDGEIENVGGIYGEDGVREFILENIIKGENNGN